MSHPGLRLPLPPLHSQVPYLGHRVIDQQGRAGDYKWVTYREASGTAQLLGLLSLPSSRLDAGPQEWQLLSGEGGSRVESARWAGMDSSGRWLRTLFYIQGP